MASNSLVDRIKSNALLPEDLQAIKALYFFVSLPKSVSFILPSFRNIIKSSYYGTMLIKDSVYELIPYKPTNLGLLYGDSIQLLLKENFINQLSLLAEIYAKLNLEFDDKWFWEEPQAHYSEFGLEWVQGEETIANVRSHIEEIADFFKTNDALTFKTNFSSLWPNLDKNSKYFVAGSIISTFNFTQSMSEETLTCHTKNVQNWVDVIKECPQTPSYCKPFAIHQIDRMLLLTNYLQYLVAKIN